MKKKGVKEKLKLISFYGLDTRDVIRAIIQISPDRLKELEGADKKQDGCEGKNNE
jgi:hypothetical protein